MNIFSILAFPLHGSRLIEASAGTGKTFSLAALYVRLVLGHGDADTGFGRPLSPRDILVITFTNAATAELRDRIRARLIDTAKVLRGQADPGSDPFLTALLQQYAPDRLQRAVQLDLAAQSMDEAAIFTIHGWCQRMLSEHAFYSGLSFNETLTDNEQRLQQQVAEDYWRTFLYPLPDTTATRRLLTLAQTPHALYRRIAGLLSPERPQSQYQGTPLPAPQPPANWLLQLDAHYRQLADIWQRASRTDVLQACTELATAIQNKTLKNNIFHPKTWDKHQPLLQAWLSNPYPPDWHQKDLREILPRYGQARISQNASKGKTAPQHSLFQLIDELVDILTQLPDAAPQLYAHAADWMGTTLTQRRRDHAELTFNDMLTRLRAALYGDGGDALAQRIRQQYPIAMVDEFQDTDPTQFAILEKLYPNPQARDTALILVGDPKQAIYSFRGADLNTYLQARRATTGNHYHLDTNYRSTQALVAAVNQLFASAEQQLPDGAFGYQHGDDNPIPFHGVNAKGQSTTLSWPDHPPGPINVWLPSDSDGLNKERYQAEMANTCAQEILALLQSAHWQQRTGEQPVRASDIAILVRNRFEAASIRTALSARGLRSVYLSDQDSVFNSDEASLLLAWLQALHSPDDEQQLRNALALPLCQCSDAQLLALLNHEQQWEKLTERAREWHRIWRRQGILPALRAWMHDLALPGRWLAMPGGERTLTNVLHLAELLQSESQHQDGEAGLLRWFALQRQQPDNHDAAILRLESDAQLIQVVSVHKSKGLQYPLVFLPFIVNFRDASRNETARYYRADTGWVLDLAADTTAKTAADRDRLLEDTRLLYVALTRAVHCCWLGLAAFNIGTERKPVLAHSAIGRLLGLSEQPTDAALVTAIDALAWPVRPVQTSSGALASADPAPRPALRLTTPLARQRWWIASYSALHLGPQAAPDTSRDAQQRDDDNSPPRYLPNPATAAGLHGLTPGSQTGTFLHGLLEHACRQGFSATALQSILPARLRQRDWQAHEPAILAWWHTLRSTPLRAGGSLADVQHPWPEMEFWLETAQVNTARLDTLIQQHLWPGHARPALQAEQLNGLLKGFIDLVFQASDGRYWVLDYKSNRLGDDEADYSDSQCRQTILAHRYDVQGCLYLLALHRLLQQREPRYLQQPDAYLGGALFWFIRAPAAGQQVLPVTLDLLDQLDQLFRGVQSHATA